VLIGNSILLLPVSAPEDVTLPDGNSLSQQEGARASNKKDSYKHFVPVSELTNANTPGVRTLVYVHMSHEA